MERQVAVILSVEAPSDGQAQVRAAGLVLDALQDADERVALVAINTDVNPPVAWISPVLMSPN